MKTSGRFSKSRGLRASVPFFPLPHPLPSTFLLSPHFSCGPNVKFRLLRTGTLCYAGYKRKLFSCFFNYRSYAKIQQDPADYDSLIWQPRLALLSHFSCSDNERPNLISRRLVVVFRAKVNLLALTIFKQRIPISGWFYYSTVKFF